MIRNYLVPSPGTERETNMCGTIMNAVMVTADVGACRRSCAFGFRVWVLGFGVLFRVQGLGFCKLAIDEKGFVLGSRFRV